ncbi:MAG TPA: CRISPR-associated endonuclease Cas2 [Candidatus Blackburnbacteria bacterium]|nr:CRISPR-associated endonuclease Cas2 [Candidatus Blackburnbacteria bacterium]
MDCMSSSKVFKVTEGFVSTFTDLTLLLIYYGFESYQARNMKGAEKAAENAWNELSEVNYESIKRALRQLRRKGLIETAKNSLLEPTRITKEGVEKIRSMMPIYRKSRTWDGKFYLVTYDIPTKRNRDRDKLREYLKKIGCGLLQESLWITPYNPTQIIREYIKERGLQGMVLVSQLGKDGSVGEMDVNELIDRVYKLSNLNSRYEDFIEKALKGYCLTSQLKFLYLSILEDDPQLPFQILPEWWLGDKAQEAFFNIKDKMEC